MADGDGAETTAERSGGRDGSRAKLRPPVSPHRQGGLPVLVVHVVLVAAGLLLTLGFGGLDPAPKGNAPACAQGHGHQDSLLDLSRRRTETAARSQLERWDTCDASTRTRARSALGRDNLLIATIALGFGLAIYRCWTRKSRRFRLAAMLATPFAVAYLVADIRENFLVEQLLKGGAWHSWLPYLSAVKLGAFFALLPLFVTSLALAIGDATFKSSTGSSAPLKDSGPPPSGGHTRAKDRLLERLAFAPGPVAAPEPPPAPVPETLGVSCSGGGVRSAAFTLGALQALNEPPAATEGQKKGDSELGRAKVLAAVSGGAYMAAAWVTGRQAHGDEAWSRLSAEEDHLRRHASYMAPGLKGKLWALARFFLGLTLNLAVFVLALGALFIPYGLAINAFALERDSVSAGGTIVLPAGGCIDTARGPFTVRPQTKVLLGPDAHVRLDPDAPAEEPAPAPAPGSVTVTKGDASVTAKGGVTASAGTVEAAGGSALAGVVIGSDSTTTSTTTTGPPPKCPTPAPTSGGPGPGRAGLPAATDGRVLRKGTRVHLDLQEGLPVRGTAVVGCDGFDGGCANPVERSLDAESRLVSAPEAVLELKGDAVVSGGGGKPAVLAQACGDTPCRHLRVPFALKSAVLATVLLAVVTGWAMLMIRTGPAASKMTQRIVKTLVAVAAVVVLAVYVLPLVTTRVATWRGWLGQRAALPGAGTLALVIAFVGKASSLGSATATQGTASSLVSRLLARLRPAIVRLASALAGPLVVTAIAVSWSAAAADEGWAPGQLGTLVAVVGLLVYVLASGDLNEWSLHPYYRERLRSAYAVDIEPGRPPTPREDPLTGLRTDGPELLLCAAANLADEQVAPPGRPVASWVFSRKQMGCLALGRALPPTAPGTLPPGMVGPGALDGGRFDHLAWTWTAVAVAGAAFSPAMGKMTRLERFAFALGNLRLGVWYPNPAYLADSKERSFYDTHWPRPWFLFKEAIGRHLAIDRWIYVTDGGHYENLGLVELLRKQCTEIYCFDAAGDKPETFGTLADAMRLAREELGIEIRIDPRAMKPDADGVSRLGVWAGTIHYPPGPNSKEPVTGWLVVAKLAVPAGAPFDIIDLARTLKSFPNHPTADQLFTDQKFEAYRALGSHLGSEAAMLGRSIRILGGNVDEAVHTANTDYCKRAQARKAACPPEPEPHAGGATTKPTPPKVE